MINVNIIIIQITHQIKVIVQKIMHALNIIIN